MANSEYSLALATTLSVLCLSSLYLTEAFSSGFSVELIHRDSPKSPYYNSLETHSQRLANAFHRSITRVSHFDRKKAVDPGVVQSIIFSNKGEYLMKISVGTPPVPIVAIADTGSDLIWTQCKPCHRCFHQEAPVFDPTKSESYRQVGCQEYPCESIEGSYCSYREPLCLYAAQYGDGSSTNGDLAIDTITLGSTTGRPVSLPKTVIGCGHHNDGTFDEKTSGIIGLGGGTGSLINQLGSFIGEKFSYCLVPFFSETKNSSKLNFGTNALISGDGTISTPLIKGDPDTFYFLIVEGISVGNKRLDFIPDPIVSRADQGNIIIDSGTTLTLLPQDFYSQLESAVADKITLERISDPTQVLSLCYKTVSDSFGAPILTVHFKGGDVKLSTSNTFVRLSEEVVCFAFRGSEGVSIYGNIAQNNFLVGYDVSQKKLSFKPTDCTSH